jgi:hypothetical protein
MEETQNPEHVVLACRLWEDFRHAAVQEGWFVANGGEAAALSLHIADLLRRLPGELLLDLQRSARSRAKADGEKMSYLFPRTCTNARASSIRIRRRLRNGWTGLRGSQERRRIGSPRRGTRFDREILNRSFA